jgi:hypothetical protein
MTDKTNLQKTCTAKTLRTVFNDFSGNQLVARTTDNRQITLICSDKQTHEIAELTHALCEGCRLNFANVREISPDVYEAEFIVFEPDYLIDVSALAECFKPFGHHPLNYLIARLHDRETTPAILLGNTANFFIDELVNETENQPAEYRAAMKKMFLTSAIDFTACEALKTPTLERKFFDDSRQQFENIRYAVNKFFPKAEIDRRKVILEPSFVCSTLGLQGRLDLMLSDFSAFIELKSGKAVDDFRTGQFIRSAEHHYMQMLLYLAILEFNLGIDPDTVRSFLFYSRYPVLSRERHKRESLAAAVHLRNLIVANEYALVAANDISITAETLRGINSKNLNTTKMSGKFFENYLAPTIDRISSALNDLNEREKAYFLRVYNFIIKELYLSKAGEKDYEGTPRASVLWNVSFDEKLAAGELLYNLTITENHADEDCHTVTLAIPKYPDLYLPNFRQGDAAILYERNSENDTVNNRRILRGAIEQIEKDKIVFRLRYKQRNGQIWKHDSLYAVEHDYMDATFTGMFRSLTAFLQANSDRKNLLTAGKNFPSFGKNFPSFENLESLNTISLLIGPPGTGKTSIALKQTVEKELRTANSNILLLSYTNRAVDEICRALSDFSEPQEFIRIGSELNCAPEFRRHLFENFLENCNSRREVEAAIDRCRIFVGTAASVWSHQEIFRLKHFSLAVVDEATQLLEPHLLGIICAKNTNGANAVDRFLLIGDHKQLPAVVLQNREESRVNEIVLNEAGIENLGDSLFERFYRTYCKYSLTDRINMLTRQGRMHPQIAAFPSEHFYDGKLESACLPHQTEEWETRRIRFDDILPSGKDFSDKANGNEADRVREICLELCREPKFSPETTGIITPYRSQIALIRQKLQETGVALLSQITVDTVERFQGSQRDTIIYSFCVKTRRQLDYLPNILEENGQKIDRKLNVALTRARKRLFIVGNRELLQQNEIYRELIEYSENHF